MTITQVGLRKQTVDANATLQSKRAGTWQTFLERGGGRGLTCGIGFIMLEPTSKLHRQYLKYLFS